MEFYRRLRELREGQGYTQEELAKKLKMEKTTISNYENERRKPTIEIVVNIAKLYNTSIDYLLGFSNIKAKLDYRIEEDKIHHKDFDRWKSLLDFIEQHGLSPEDAKDILQYIYTSRDKFQNPTRTKQTSD